MPVLLLSLLPLQLYGSCILRHEIQLPGLSPVVAAELELLGLSPEHAVALEIVGYSPKDALEPVLTLFWLGPQTLAGRPHVSRRRDAGQAQSVAEPRLIARSLPV